MEGASRVRRSTKNGSLTRAGCVGSNKGDMRIKSRGSLVTGSGGSVFVNETGQSCMGMCIT